MLPSFPLLFWGSGFYGGHSLGETVLDILVRLCYHAFMSNILCIGVQQCARELPEGAWYLERPALDIN